METLPLAKPIGSPAQVGHEDDPLTGGDCGAQVQPVE
jgi:hypothetical protein